MQFEIQPNQPLKGEIAIPGDKSISHRAILLSAIAEGVSHIEGFLFGADNLATLSAMRQLGVSIQIDTSLGQVTVEGKGLYGLNAPKSSLDMENSGTAMRLFTGLLSGQSFDSTLIGDESLSKRPMGRVVKPLRMMGASISLTAQETAPIVIHGGHALHGINYDLPVASAQVKSALLLAGLYAKGSTCITEPGVTRDHTERMLRAYSYPVESQGSRVGLTSGYKLKAAKIHVPGDISSAAFFMVAASIIPGSEIILKNVGINPTRMGIIHLLQAMDANIQLFNERKLGDEPVADVAVKYARLKGIDIPKHQVPLAIDEMPVLMIAAACAEGVTRLSGAEELRVKETDRIAAMAKGLKTLNIVCEPTPDGIIIQGGQFTGGRIDSFSDHRIAMSFAVAGCVAKNVVIVDDCRNVQTSFPNFVDLARSVGMTIQVR